MVRVEHKKGRPLTEGQIAEVEAAKGMPITFDEDSPKLTPAMEKAFLLAASARDRDRHRKGAS